MKMRVITLQKLLNKFPNILTFHRLQEYKSKESDFSLNNIVRKPSQTLYLLSDFEENLQRKDLPIMMLKNGATKTTRIFLKEFLLALQSDLWNLFTNLECIWGNYTKLLRSKPEIIKCILRQAYEKNIENLNGKWFIFLNFYRA